MIVTRQPNQYMVIIYVKTKVADSYSVECCVCLIVICACHDKTCLRDFQPGPAQTGHMFSHMHISGFLMMRLNYDCLPRDSLHGDYYT